MKHAILLSLLAFVLVTSCNRDPYTYAVITTGYGDITIKLYNSTPEHRDNFIKLVKEEFYDYTLFHRVVPDFIVQGGDPKSRNAHPLDLLGEGDPGYLLEPEIGALHVRGAVGAARKSDDINPTRKSNGSQFYLVWGAGVDDATLDTWEQRKGIKYSEAQRKLYKEKGGLPYLDMDYTVFGEIVDGLDILEKMDKVSTSRNDRPTDDIRMKIRLIEK
ncbi:MAG: peptidylprolyl isomerase [Saprospiraceae bacterium]|nr:peptidylprolyl isomerase [Saprospiraceae bacterium]